MIYQIEFITRIIIFCYNRWAKKFGQAHTHTSLLILSILGILEDEGVEIMCRVESFNWEIAYL